jgi:hypothetical protein
MACNDGGVRGCIYIFWDGKHACDGQAQRKQPTSSMVEHIDLSSCVTRLHRAFQPFDVNGIEERSQRVPGRPIQCLDGNGRSVRQ